MNRFILAVVASVVMPASLFACMQADYAFEELGAPIDYYISEKTCEDVTLWESIRSQGLLFEKPDRSFFQMMKDFLKDKDPYEPERQRVNKRLREQFHAKQRMITTRDNVSIATLTRTVPHARATLVYVTGYFPTQTPTKEWAAPFYQIFHDCNIVSFDWRSAGDSNGTFSEAATEDIRAVLADIQQNNMLKNTPVVVCSFCMGGALAAQALAQLENDDPSLLPSALMISCTQSKINLDRAIALSPNPAMTLIGRLGLLTSWSRKIMVRKLFSPALEKFCPMDRIAELSIPICFEHCMKKDLFAPMADCYQNYDSAHKAPHRAIIASELAGHVRLHKETPVQYREAYFDFFSKAGVFGRHTAPLINRY